MPIQLYDNWGHKVELARLREEESGPTVTGVRQPLSNHPADGLTPARLAGLLNAAEIGDADGYLDLAEQMEEKDLHYRSVLGTRRNQVAGLEVTVEAASDDADDVKAADLVREALWRDGLREELFDILDAVGKGYSVTEIIWDTEAGKSWMPVRLEWRQPRWFEFDRVDRTTLRLRDAGGVAVPLKPFGYIRHVSKTKSGLPIRGGLARPVAWYYLFKNFDIRSWVQFGEAYGKPIRIGKYGPGASDADKATLLRAVRNIWADAAAIIPESMMIELVEAKISGSIDLFERQADWFDRQVSKGVLGQTGTTDTGTRVGTADAHEKVRDDIEDSDAAQLGAALTRDLAKPIVDLNMGARRRYPRVMLHRPDQEDTGALVDNIVKLVPLGLRVERSWMADKIGVPDPDKKAELLTAPRAAAKPAQDPAQELPEEETTAQSQADVALSPLRDSVERIAAQLEGAAGSALDRQIDRLKEVVMDPSIDSLETLSARLLDAYPGMDPSEIAEQMASALLVANLSGRDEVDDA
jgi:phage gp29-like protein